MEEQACSSETPSLSWAY